MATASPNPAYPPSGYAWGVVCILLLAMTLSFVDRQILSLMVQPVRTDLRLSDTRLSLLHGFAFAIFYAVLGLSMGRLADRGNRSRMIVAGIVVWSLATAACGLAQTFGELFVARIFVGAGEAVLAPAAYSMIADYFPLERRARAMSVFSSGIFVGSGLALFLGGAAVQAAMRSGTIVLPVIGLLRSWQAVFVMVGMPGLLIAALMLWVREPHRTEVAPGRDESVIGALRFIRERARLIAAINCGFGLGGGIIVYGFGAWLPTLFIRVHHWQPARAAAAMGAISLTCGIAGVVIGGWLGDRAVRRGDGGALLRLPVLGILGIIPAAAAVGLSTTSLEVLVAYCWLSFCLGLPTALGIPALQTITPNQYRGQIVALYLLCANAIGLGIGPTLIALSTDYLFHDDVAIGKSLALVSIVSAGMAIMILTAAQKRYSDDLLAMPVA